MNHSLHFHRARLHTSVYTTTLKLYAGNHSWYGYGPQDVQLHLTHSELTLNAKN